MDYRANAICNAVQKYTVEMMLADPKFFMSI